MEAGPAGAYQQGLKYMGAGRRLNIIARALELEDADLVRKLADRLSAKGLDLLRRAVKPGA